MNYSAEDIHRNRKNNIGSLFGVHIGPSTLEKGLHTEIEGFEKGGKRAQIGEVRMWGSEKWVKHSDGWVHVNEKSGRATLERPGGKRETASEEHISHHKAHLDRHTRESNTHPHLRGFNDFQVGDFALLGRVKVEITRKEPTGEIYVRENSHQTPKWVFAKDLKKVEDTTEIEAEEITNSKPNVGDHSSNSKKEGEYEKYTEAIKAAGKYIASHKTNKNYDPDTASMYRDRVKSLGIGLGLQLKVIDDAISTSVEAYKEKPEPTGEKLSSTIKELESLGVRVNRNPTNQVSPIQSVSIPINQSDETYDKINKILDLNNIHVKKVYHEQKTSTVSSDNTHKIGDSVKVSSSITSDPSGNKGKSGKIVSTEDDVHDVEFEDGSRGKYMDNTLEKKRDSSKKKSWLEQVEEKFPDSHRDSFYKRAEALKSKMRNDPGSKQYYKKELDKVYRESEKFDRDKIKATINFPKVLKIFKSFGVIGSKESTTAIRGFTRSSPGYDYPDYSPRDIGFNHISTSTFNSIVEELKSNGFQVSKISPPSKIIIGGSHGSLTIDKYNGD